MGNYLLAFLEVLGTSSLIFDFCFDIKKNTTAKPARMLRRKIINFFTTIDKIFN